MLQLKADASLDHEMADTVTVTVTVTDAGGLSASTDVTVTVNDLNEAPSISIADGAVDENASGAVAAEVMATDPDDGDTHTFMVTDERFEVMDGMLQLKADASLDHETADTVMMTVTVTDAGGLSASTDVTVMVNDVNEAPEISAADGAVDENASGAVVGEVMATDVDAGDSHTFTTDDERFEVMDGMLQLKADASLDHEMADMVTVTVTVTDAGGLSASTDVTVTVNDLNEAPMISVADDDVDENMAGETLGEITFSDPDMGQMHTLSTSDERFVTMQDDDGGWWLALAEGVSLNHEAAATVTVTVTVMDDGDPAMSDDTDVVITVNDINEPPVAGMDLDNITGESGTAIKAAAIDLAALFSDPDAGDSMRYELRDAPSWMNFSVEYGKDKDGNDTTHGLLSGTPPVVSSESDGTHMVSIVAIDEDGSEGSASFYVVIDDGNDAITAVDLLDSNGNVIVEGDVEENDSSGMVFGRIRVEDQDSADHPNGMHKIEVLKGDTDSVDPSAEVDERFEVRYDDAGDPWLALKEGMSLDKENPDGNPATDDDGYVDVTIRVIDKAGATNSSGSAFTGNVEHRTVTILIEDQNDAPTANTIGNWWVTAEDGQRSDDIMKGAWLTFSLETGMGKPAFTDPDGDTLTYSLSGPSWLEINAATGQITNTKGGVPVRGVHQLTVTATDPSGESASASFDLAVALSGDGTDDTASDDNDTPRFGSPTEYDYTENSGERRVATFTVTDEDNDLGHHPFALDSVKITSVVNSDDNSDSNNRTDVSVAGGYAAAFRLSEPRKSGDTWTYDVYVRDTNPSSTVDTTSVLNHENVDRIKITVTADDGVANPVTEEIDVRIDDANDVPVLANLRLVSGNLGMSQSERFKKIVYIKLEHVWTDAEDDPDDLTYGVSVSGSWIKVLAGPAEWGDIEGIEWFNQSSDSDEYNVVIAGNTYPEPAANQLMVVLEFDRTGMNNGQDEEGSFTLTATDRDGGTGSRTFKIVPNDQNLKPMDAVSISGSAREDATLRASFNDDKDPDLAGPAMPALVLYQWFRADDAQGMNEEMIREGTSSSYTLTQADVGKYVTVKVKYYEVFGRQLVGYDVDDTAAPNQATTSRMISDTPDKGMGHITILADGNELSVSDDGLSISDGDWGGPVPDDNVTISWEISDNGRGGWEAVPQADDAKENSLTLDNGNGKWYRAVATYDADGMDVGADGAEMESVYSDPIQVANVRDDAKTAPAITGNAFPGGTLSVDEDGTSVQWQIMRGTDWMDIDGATGSLNLTEAHAGATVRALVSYNSTSGVTAVVAVEQMIGGSPLGSARPVAVDNHEILLEVEGTGHHPTGGSTNNAGHNLSYTGMVDLASLFQDPDSTSLTFKVNADSSLRSNSGFKNGSTYVFDQADGGVLVFEADTGKLIFNSDVYRTHDGKNNDGGGNVLTLNITANDGGGDSAEPAQVTLRINVAPTGIWFATAADGKSDSTLKMISVMEHTGSAAAGSAGQFIAKVDVQDENSSMHSFGSHLVNLTGDDRFMITKSDDDDGSTWEVRLKKGEKLDYEAENADGDATIKLKLTATDKNGDGLSTPAEVTLTITVTNDTSDDATATDDANDVPGLTDNDSDTGNDVVDGDDSDTDGGTKPPPPGMSIGAIIEDFVNNMDTFEQDLLEDFMLVIDDGLDIA